MELLSNWLRNIVFVVLFLSLMEMLLPDKKLKGTVRFVLGLLLIFTLLSPFVEVGNMEIPAAIDIFDDLESEADIPSNHDLTAEIFMDNLMIELQNYCTKDEKIEEAVFTSTYEVVEGVFIPEVITIEGDLYFHSDTSFDERRAVMEKLYVEFESNFGISREKMQLSERVA